MCVYWEKDGNGGALFSAAILKRLAALDLALGVTIYYFDDPEDTFDDVEEASDA